MYGRRIACSVGGTRNEKPMQPLPFAGFLVQGCFQELTSLLVSRIPRFADSSSRVVVSRPASATEATRLSARFLVHFAC